MWNEVAGGFFVFSILFQFFSFHSIFQPWALLWWGVGKVTNNFKGCSIEDECRSRNTNNELAGRLQL